MHLRSLTSALINFFMVFLFSDLTSARQECGDLFNVKHLQQDAVRRLFDHIEETLQPLYKTSGFLNDANIKLAAESTQDEIGILYREASNILTHERFHIVIRLPVRIRAKIAKSGFLNGHQTEDSQGAVLGRSTAEARTANLTLDQWSNLPDEVKPKFAALYPEQNSTLTPPETLNWYTGGDKYYFKLGPIRDRMTITPGDSLNRFVYWTGGFGEFQAPVSWDQLYIPWSHRSLMIPVLAEGLKERRLGLPKLSKPGKYEARDHYGYQQSIQGHGALKDYKMAWNPNMDYLETQIWGPLNLEDVAIFEYTTSPPKGNFLNELLRLGIEIRDGRPSRRTSVLFSKPSG